jgi:hypothetical protein
MSHTSNTQTISKTKPAITRAINSAQKVARHLIRNFQNFNNLQHARVHPLFPINLAVEFSSPYEHKTGMIPRAYQSESRQARRDRRDSRQYLP